MTSYDISSQSETPFTVASETATLVTTENLGAWLKHDDTMSSHQPAAVKFGDNGDATDATNTCLAAASPAMFVAPSEANEMTVEWGRAPPHLQRAARPRRLSTRLTYRRADITHRASTDHSAAVSQNMMMSRYVTPPRFRTVR